MPNSTGRSWQDNTAQLPHEYTFPGWDTAELASVTTQSGRVLTSVITGVCAAPVTGRVCCCRQLCAFPLCFQHSSNSRSSTVAAIDFMLPVFCFVSYSMSYSMLSNDAADMCLQRRAQRRVAREPRSNAISQESVFQTESIHHLRGICTGLIQQYQQQLQCRGISFA